MSPPNPAHVSSKGLLRRRWPRLEVGGKVQANIASLDLAMPVRDISFGGFAVDAPLRFAQGEIHEFSLRLDQAPPLRVRARAAYCHGKGNTDHQFITGWEALGDPDTARAMTLLVNGVAAMAAAETGALAES